MENTECVNCSMSLNTNTEITGNNEQPRINDLTICMYCGQPYYFNEQLLRVPMSKDEFRKLPAHDKQLLREAWDIRAKLLQEAKKKNPLH